MSRPARGQLLDLIRQVERAADERAAEILRKAADRTRQSVDVAQLRSQMVQGERLVDEKIVEVLEHLARQGREVDPKTVALYRGLLLRAEGLVDRETLELLYEAAMEPFDPDGEDQLRMELVRQLLDPVDAIVRAYFRMDVEGVDRVPPGPALLVSNHEGGISFVQVLAMGARLYLELGMEERIHGLMHDGMFEVPLLGNVLGHLGAIRASHESADKALGRGSKVYVAPGGNLEAFRPFSERFQIKFGGRRGWVRLALRNRVPIVPVVFIGGQETFFVLRDGAYLAQRLRLKQRFRLDTFPLFLGLPWGIGFGPMFHLPLPAKCKVRFLDPVPIDVEPGLTDSEAEDLLYEKVTRVMQEALTEMAEQRRFPVIG